MKPLARLTYTNRCVVVLLSRLWRYQETIGQSFYFFMRTCTPKRKSNVKCRIQTLEIVSCGSLTNADEELRATQVLILRWTTLDAPPKNKPHTAAGSLGYQLWNFAHPSSNLQWVAFSVCLKISVNPITNQLPSWIRKRPGRGSYCQWLRQKRLAWMLW